MVLIGSCSLPGTRYGSLNQDFVAVEEMHASKDLKKNHWTQLHVVVMCDGHGMLGEIAAEEASRAILDHLRQSVLRRRQLGELSLAEVTQLMEEAFLAGHQRVLRLYEAAPATYDFPKGSKSEQTYSLRTHPNREAVYMNALLGNRILEFGTTATVACVQGTAIAVANAGDTRVVLGRDVAGEYSGDDLTLRHWGFEASEAKRLKDSLGDVVSIAAEDGYLTVEEGRLRGFQLAMTRALGHKLLGDYGVIPNPFVQVHSLQQEDVCLIVATDGIWEVMNAGEAVRSVCDAIAEGRTVEDAAYELCSDAVRMAVNFQRGGEADNTTAAVFIFDEL